MLHLLHAKLSNPQNVAAIMVAIAVFATIITLAMPMFARDTLATRMKNVASERERIRQRERERLSHRDNRVSLRVEPKAYMKSIVDNFNLARWLGTDHAKAQLAMAGFRGAQAEIAFLFFRLVSPIVLFIATLIYMVFQPDISFTMKVGAAVAAAYAGIKTPEVFLKNRIGKRQTSMRRAFPDAMDLLLICVESGMSIEPAFRKVSSEIGAQSVELGEEFALATAELSYLPDRRAAYENLATRTGVDGIRQVSTVLIQAEKYGTPLGQALRVVSQESRDTRMMEAEKKAAALPPKLTVPMIVFFLPVLFAVIMTPAGIQVAAQM